MVTAIGGVWLGQRSPPIISLPWIVALPSKQQQSKQSLPQEARTHLQLIEILPMSDGRWCNWWLWFPSKSSDLAISWIEESPSIPICVFPAMSPKLLAASRENGQLELCCLQSDPQVGQSFPRASWLYKVRLFCPFPSSSSLPVPPILVRLLLSSLLTRPCASGPPLDSWTGCSLLPS